MSSEYENMVMQAKYRGEALNNKRILKYKLDTLKEQQTKSALDAHCSEYPDESLLSIEQLEERLRLTGNVCTVLKNWGLKEDHDITKQFADNLCEALKRRG